MRRSPRPRTGLTAAHAALLALALPALAAAATETKPLEPGPWKFGATVGVQFAQSAFSSNWKGGEKGSVVWIATSDLTAERQFSRSFNLSSRLRLAYGQTTRQKDDPDDPRARVWDVPEKTTDQVALESVARFPLHAFVDPYFAFQAESQFSDESSPLGSIAFNPIRLKETVGVAHVFEKTDGREFISRLGVGLRQTFGRSFADPVTLRTERFAAHDGGIEWRTEMKRPLLDGRVLYRGSLGIFQSAFYSKRDDLRAFDAEAADSAAAAGTTHGAVAGFWKALDVDFQSTFTAQITKVLSVNLSAQWVYDKFDASANLNPALPFAARRAEVDRTVRKAGQFQETMTLGITYRLF